MKRTPYERPVTEVVTLQQRGQVMIVSQDGQAGVQNYYWNPETIEE